MKVAMKPIHIIGRILPSSKDLLTLEEKSCLVYQVPYFIEIVYLVQSKIIGVNYYIFCCSHSGSVFPP